MTWFGYVLVGVIAFGTLCSVATVGKPRPPLSAEVAVLVVVTNALLIWGAIAVGTTQ